MYSLKKRALIGFTMVWTMLLILFSGIMYLQYRQGILSVLSLFDKGNSKVEVFFQSYGVESSQFFYNPEAVIGNLFWIEYRQTLLLLILIGGIILIVILILMNQYLTTLFGKIQALLRLDGRSVKHEQLPFEFAEVSQKIIESKEQILKLNSQNEQFQAYASHELRNELITLKGLLYRYQINEPLILQQQGVLEETVEDLLILSYSIESVHVESVDPLLILAEAVDAFSADGGITFQFDETENWQPIYTRENWLYRSFYNMIDNAIRYRKIGSEVVVSAHIFQGAIIVKIENVCHRDIAEMSDFLLHAEGHGIGLKLVQHVAKAMKGRHYYEISGDKVRTILSLPFSKI